MTFPSLVVIVLIVRWFACLVAVLLSSFGFNDVVVSIIMLLCCDVVTMLLLYCCSMIDHFVIVIVGVLKMKKKDE